MKFCIAPEGLGIPLQGVYGVEYKTPANCGIGVITLAGYGTPGDTTEAVVLTPEFIVNGNLDLTLLYESRNGAGKVNYFDFDLAPGNANLLAASLFFESIIDCNLHMNTFALVDTAAIPDASPVLSCSCSQPSLLRDVLSSSSSI